MKFRKYFTIEFLFIICLNFCLNNAEYYTSIYKMSQLLNIEIDNIYYIKKFIRKNEMKLNFLKERLLEYEHEYNEALAAGKKYFDNPINRYTLVKHLTLDWRQVESTMKQRKGNKSLQKLNAAIVNSTELQGAIDGILRLQDFYRLNTVDINNGKLSGVQYNTYFESHHRNDIGKRALEMGFEKMAHNWLMAALNSFDETTTKEYKLTKIDIQLELIKAKLKLGDFKGGNQTLADLLESYPENQEIIKFYNEFFQNIKNNETIEVDYKTEHPPPHNIYVDTERNLYKYTCAGLLKSTAAEERDLRCRYLTKTHPFLLLAPVKVEELNHDPLLVMYHDLISDTEIATLKGLGKTMTRAKVMGGRIIPNRTSQFQFFAASSHPLLQTIDRRLEDISNLNMSNSEHHQLCNYGIGGHYNVHKDFFNATSMADKSTGRYLKGNRIATALFYLSNVEQGGGTAFPFLKKLVFPIKGSAVFWYNLYASGVPDNRTAHGACPIIVGSKWVLNRWIRERHQSDRRPCYLFNDALQNGMSHT